MVAYEEIINMRSEQGKSGWTLAKIGLALRSMSKSEKPDGVPTRHG